MKIARFFSTLFLSIGVALMAGGVVASLLFLRSPEQTNQVPPAAKSCAEGLARAISSGSEELTPWFTVPVTRPRQQIDDPVRAALWDACCSAVECRTNGATYADSTGVYQELVIIVPAMEELLNAVEEQARADLLNLSADKFNDDGTLPDAARQRLILDAYSKVRNSGIPTRERTVTLTLTAEDGSWKAIPSKDLLSALDFS